MVNPKRTFAKPTQKAYDQSRHTKLKQEAKQLNFARRLRSEAQLLPASALPRYGYYSFVAFND